MQEKGLALWGHAQQIMLHILRTGGCTKPQLSRATGLTASAVHGIVQGLEKAGAILPSGMASSEGGRRATSYEINAALGRLLSVSIRVNRLELALFDLKLQPTKRHDLPWHIGAMGPETYVSRLAQEIEAFLTRSAVPRDSLAGVGVCVPGPVDADGTVQKIAAAPQWLRYPLRQRLQDALRLPVAVEKDVYAAIRYLDMSGILRGSHSCAYLSICEGVGAALMMHGKVFHGAHSLAGEIGHLTVRKDGIPCTCGNTGCLELYCSDTGIVQQYNAQAGAQLSTITQVLSCLAAGDDTARRVLSQAVNYLVETTASIIMNYDPEELLIYSTWLSQENQLYFRMLDTLYAKSIFTRGHAVDIRLLGDEPLNLPAAAALAWERLLLSRQCPLLGQF